MNAPLTPWRPHLDYAGEPMFVGEFRDPPIDLYDELGTIEHYEKVARHLRRLNRQEKWERVVKAGVTVFCLAIAALCILYFGLQLARAL